LEDRRVLVVDDEESMCLLLRKALEKEGYEVTAVGTGNDALREVRSGGYSVVILDLKLPGMDGMTCLREIRGIDPLIPVVIITAHGSRQTAFDALKQGAYDYFSKPFDIDEMRTVVGRAFEKWSLEKEVSSLRERLGEGEGEFVAESEPMRRVRRIVSTVAAQDVTVLITGESGTGKELVARMIHRESRRRNGPFITLNCAAIPETLLESEMFGHEKGAFTGAFALKKGKFELAEKGTIFLDEIGDMSPSTQSKLLRVLDNREFQRVGGTRDIKADVRIIAATNVDLKKAIAEKRFREDLFYRINVVSIELPPLRERMEDLEPLIDLFIGRFNRKFGKEIKGVSPEVMELFRSYHWPGNVRELENVIQSSVVLEEGELISLDSLPAGFLKASSDGFGAFGDLKLGRPLTETLREVTRRVERKLISEALKESGGNRSRAAAILGITRGMLHRKIRKYGIAPPKR